ncbi:tripartite tricarboxylate transporter TctB family protein [Thermus thermamylovorans]|uniref:Tripartite tricarboxylate transporter TctB family protein n=1 Tax=Thermus thermamylovorans TaxID=2509362 RepID=A0A4Q9B4B1_9DEIN|nr:tripartite tricarboxylate transporter TctB family protein [Thermus thermamylovorans]
MPVHRGNLSELTLGIAGMAFAIWYGLGALDLLGGFSPTYLSPGLVPLLVSGILALLFATYTLINAIEAWNARRGKPSSTLDQDPGKESNWRTLFLLVGLTGLYTLGIHQLGFLIATPPYILLVLHFCGVRLAHRPTQPLFWSIGITIGLYVIFHEVFGVPVPGIGGR